MPKSNRLFLMIALSALLMLNISCGKKSSPFLILTDRKELAAAAEIFDAAHPEIYMVVHHVPYIDADLVKLEKPDLVIGRNLMAEEITNLLRPTSDDYPVYEAFKGKPDSRGRRYLTHLSFGLPLIVGKKEVVGRLPDPVEVNPEQLQAASLPYTERNKDGRPVKMGFSPSWRPEIYTDLMLLKDPSSLDSGIENIDSNLTDSVVKEARDWIIAAAGDLAADLEFNRRYRYVSDEYLILDGRILFTYMDFGQWNNLPDRIAAQLDFRYLSGQRTTPVIWVVSAGVPKKSKHAGTAGEFIDWLMRKDVQINLMGQWSRNGINVFGFLGGLSTLPEVNETEIVRRNPAMSGKILESHYYSVPALVPHRWIRIREFVTTGWFASAINGSAVGTLAEAYRRWDLSSLAEAE